MKLIQKGLLSILLACASSLPASDTPETTPKQSIVHASIMQPLVEKLVALVAKLDALIEDLSLEISVGTLKPAIKKEDVITKLTEIRQLTFMLKNNEFLGAQPQDLLRATTLTHSLLKLVNASLKNNFKDFESVDIESVFKKSIEIDTEISPEEVDTKITRVAKACDIFSARAKTAGLAWYNHAFRKFDRTIMQPCFKYNVPKIAAIVGLTAAATFTGWFYGGWESPTFVRNYTGFPVPDNMLAVPDDKKPVHRLGHIFKSLTDYARGGLAPLNYIVPPLAVAYGFLAKEINAFVSEKATNLANFLRGGEYRYKKGGITQWNDISSDFNSIIGCDYQKQQCLPILDYLANAEMHGRKKSFPDKGYLLIGGPGSGKTEFAKALCGEIKKQIAKSNNGTNFKYYSFSASEILLPLENGGLFGSVESMFASLRSIAPVVVFIDEIHLLGAQSSNPRVLSEFLTGMSGFMETDPAKQVILLAATNKPEQIDEALRRKGRFGTTLHFDLPNFENRREYLVRRLSELALDVNLFDVERLARETDGCNYEDLNSMVKSAFRKAKIMGTTVSQALLEDSLNDEIRSIIHSPDENISAQEQALIAAYLTGSALTRILLNTTDKVSYITLNPVNIKITEKPSWWYSPEEKKQPLNKEAIQYGKVFTYRATDSLKIDSKKELELEIKVLLAGSIAQEMLFNTCTLDYQNEDKKQALGLAQKICLNGMDLNKLPKEVQKEKLTQAYNLIIKLENEVKELLQQNSKALDMLTQMIMEHKSLSGEQFVYFVGFADRLAKDQLTPEEKEMMEQGRKAFEEAQSKQQADAPVKNSAPVIDPASKEIGLEAVTN